MKITPYQKAIELVERFNKIWSDSPIDISSTRYDAIQAALECVDNMIEETRDYCEDSYTQARINYWGDVKLELNKL